MEMRCYGMDTENVFRLLMSENKIEEVKLLEKKYLDELHRNIQDESLHSNKDTIQRDQFSEGLISLSIKQKLVPDGNKHIVTAAR